MRLFGSLTLQRLIGSLGHRRGDAKDLQRKTISICPHGHGNTDPVVWFRTEPEYSLSYADPGWGVCRPPRRINLISLGQFTDH